MDVSDQLTDRPNRLVRLAGGLAAVALVAASIFGIYAATAALSGDESPVPPEDLSSASSPLVENVAAEGNIAADLDRSLTSNVAKALADQNIVAKPSGVTVTDGNQQIAAETVIKEFGLRGESVATGAALVRLSTPKMGVERQQDFSKPSDLDPLYVDRLVWIVTVENVPSTPFGGAGMKVNETGTVVPDQGAPLKVDLGTMTGFVDAETGKFLFGLSF